MKYFPTEQVTYKSNLSKEEVLERIRKEITPKYLHQNETERFTGKIAGDTFILKKVNLRPTSSLPSIDGTVVADGTGTIVTLNITLIKFIRVFVTAFMAFSLIMPTNGLLHAQNFTKAGLILLSLLFNALFFIGVRALINQAFNRETQSVHRDFKDILEAKS